MKFRIAFATEDSSGLDAKISAHFGRCPFYTFVEVENGKVVEVLSVPNPAIQEHQPGQIPQFIAEQGCDIIVSGGMGPRAQQWFLSLGVKLYVGVRGKIKDVLALILEGKLKPLESIEKQEGCKRKDNCH